MKTSSIVYRKLVVILLIVAQLGLILNDFPPYDNDQETSITSRSPHIKYFVSESEAVDGEEDQVDLCILNLYFSDLKFVFFKPTNRLRKVQPQNISESLCKKNLYIAHCSFLI